MARPGLCPHQSCRRGTQEQIKGRFQLACFQKQYSLAGKFFEYLIEPMVSDVNSFYYDSGFHKFIANGLYFAAADYPDSVALTPPVFFDGDRHTEGDGPTSAGDDVDRPDCFFGSWIVPCENAKIDPSVFR